MLAANVPDLSRRKARVLLEIGGVFVDRRRVKVASRTLRAGQVVEVTLGGALRRATGQTGQAARDADDRELPAFQVVFEDDDVVVVVKPSGLLTAPTPESDRGNLADLLARGCPAGAPGPREKVWVVHRLDMETSGLLVFARNAAANRFLAERFRDHDVHRGYKAVVAGRVQHSQQTIDTPVGKRAATTHLSLERHLGDAASVIEARLETGRTHQIRIHCQGIGHPVLADPRYGSELPPGLARPPRMALHAFLLGFAHPRTGEPQRFEQDWPPDMAGWLEHADRDDPSTD